MRAIGGKVIAGVVAAVAALLVAAAPAPAAGLETILQDDAQLLHRPEDQLRRSLQEMRLLGIDRIRVTAGWSVITRDADKREKPRFDATQPAAYEQERWRTLDRLLVLAREYGFRTMIDIAFWAPHWASSDPIGERGRTDVDVEEYARFATAVARRYSGSFVIPRAITRPRGPLYEPSDDERFLAEGYGSVNPATAGRSLHESLGLSLLAGDDDPVTAATSPLPKVDVYTIWNEPNHTSFLRPQWYRSGGRWLPRSPHVYRAMVHASYTAIKAARPDASVLVGGTSFNGAYGNTGNGSVPPLRFLRELACVDRHLRPLRRSGCAGFRTVPADGYAHHPYTMTTEPDARSRSGHPDDVPIAELPKLARLLERLIGRGRLAPGARDLWVTEYGYETNPPVPGWIWSPGDQVRFLTWAEYLAAKVPTVRSFAQFLLRDLPPSAFRVGESRRRAFGQWQSGLLYEAGEPKLAAHSFRAGLYVQRTRRGRLRLWGRLRLGGGLRTVAAEQYDPAARRWSTLSTVAPGRRSPTRQFTADGTQPFLRFASGPREPGRRYRLRYLDGDRWVTTPLVAPVER